MNRESTTVRALSWKRERPLVGRYGLFFTDAPRSEGIASKRSPRRIITFVHLIRPDTRKACEIAAELIARPEEHGSAEHIGFAAAMLALARMFSSDFELAAQGFDRARELLESIVAEAGDELFTFTSFPSSQWKALRTTNALERINGEFRRRSKTQASQRSEEAVLFLLFGLLRSGQITLRRLVGWQAPPIITRKRRPRSSKLILQ